MPILIFTYYNPVLAYGVEAFASDCHEAGVDGVLCVDLPPEEDPAYKANLDAKGIATVYLIAPTTTPERMEIIARNSTGFAYYVSRIGVTGVRSDVESTVGDAVAELKRHAQCPVAVGFGISTPEQAAEVAGFADGVIVGSAIVRLIGELGDSPDAVAKVGAFAKALVDGAKGRAVE